MKIIFLTFLQKYKNSLIILIKLFHFSTLFIVVIFSILIGGTIFSGYFLNFILIQYEIIFNFNDLINTRLILKELNFSFINNLPLFLVIVTMVFSFYLNNFYNL